MFRAPSAGATGSSSPGSSALARPGRIFNQGGRVKEERESGPEADNTQEVVPATRPHITGWSTTVATSTSHGPQGGMRAADQDAASFQFRNPGAFGVQLAGLSIEEDRFTALQRAF